jgi:hypothetical protein
MAGGSAGLSPYPSVFIFGEAMMSTTEHIRDTSERISKCLDQVLQKDIDGREEAIAFAKIAGRKIENLDYECGDDLNWRWPTPAGDQYRHVVEPVVPAELPPGPSYRDRLLSLRPKTSFLDLPRDEQET